MNKRVSMNRDWLYRPEFHPSYRMAGFRPDNWEAICLPHTNKELAYNGFDETLSQFVSSYWRKLVIPSACTRCFLDFEGVMCAAEVWVNGELAATHLGGYTPFSVELSRFGQPGDELSILVKVDSTERSDIPPFGHVVDYLCYGGIYREVTLRQCGAQAIRSVYARPDAVLSAQKNLDVEIELEPRTREPQENASLQSAGLAVRASLAATAAPDRIIAAIEVPVPSGDFVRFRMEKLAGIELWDLDQPNLYELTVELYDSESTLDEETCRVGFRAAEFRPDGFWLNGRRLAIRGLNRHQSWPYVGYAMPERAQRRDALILKQELGVNLVRASHYPQSRHFLDACDELGLLVFEELPGWQHIGDQKWQDHSCGDLEAMIRRDRNHPSIVLWGVRINESADNHDFFTRTNALARRLDPSRQTGGVRCIERSEFLEDVYTFNDFSHSGGKLVLRRPKNVTKLKHDVPYLVSEHNGHMFPTKRFDNEERLAEHALRHARVLDTAAGMRGCSGAVGWCAFDYNTHKDFGSGDRICYHGVMDMFRHAKPAAWVYASQLAPERRIVLEAASLFAKGERCAARMLPIEVYTNCDSVVLYRAGARIGEYFPDRKTFPHLEHPPVVIRDLVGDQLVGSRFSTREQKFLRLVVGIVLSRGMEGLGLLQKIRLGLLFLKHRLSMSEATALVGKYAIGWGSKDERFEIAGLLAGKEVCRRSYGGDARAVRLELCAEDTSLRGGDWDTTRVSVRALDQYGNLHPYVAEAIVVSVEGPAIAIGPSLLPLTGGCAAFWLRTSGEAGSVLVRINSERFGGQELRVEVKAPD